MQFIACRVQICTLSKVFGNTCFHLMIDVFRLIDLLEISNANKPPSQVGVLFCDAALTTTSVVMIDFVFFCRQ